MNFRELSYIVSIANHQSLGLAAKENGVTQPALSKFIHSLEKELGQPVFRKIGNKFLLTHAGTKYVEKAKILLSIKQELDLEMADFLPETKGTLNIAFPTMRGTYMLPSTLPAFRSKYPDVNVIVHEADSAQLEEMVLQGNIDLAFFTLPIHSTDISYEVISHEEIVLVMSPDHHLTKHGISKSDCKYPWIDLSLLEHEPLLLQRFGQRTRRITDELLQKAGVEPNIILESRNILAAAQLAALGHGMAFINETHLKHIHFYQPPACFSIGEPFTETSFIAAFRRGIYIPKYIKEYIQIVKDHS